MFFVRISLMVMTLFLSACQVLPADTLNVPLDTGRFMAPKGYASMQSNEIREASGLVRSAVNPGLLWTHNDSGDAARVFLIDPLSGSIRMEVVLDGVKNIDFEDITLREEDGQSKLVVADIGDNRAVRDEVVLYQFNEPELGDLPSLTIPFEKLEVMRLRYVEGPRDAESLMAAPDGSLVLLTKREEQVLIYPFHFEPGSSTLESSGELALSMVTAGDMNEAGEILIRTYDAIYYWPKAPGELAERLATGPGARVLAPSEIQGEAICWDGQGGFYTLSEQLLFSTQRVFHALSAQ